MRWVWLVIGVLAVAAGVLWTLQGLNILGGSVMSGSHLWAIIGPIVGLVGLALIGVGLLRRRTSAS
ncbi:MAG TPA: hypothetical protein VMV29_00820 [Ktedonobacterales bacterium]|nr:hypothetical protein [Ktedonobacterales bacterium]